MTKETPRDVFYTYCKKWTPIISVNKFLQKPGRTAGAPEGWGFLDSQTPLEGGEVVSRKHRSPLLPGDLPVFVLSTASSAAIGLLCERVLQFIHRLFAIDRSVLTSFGSADEPRFRTSNKYFTFVWPCIVTIFFIIKPSRCTNLFCHETLHVSDSSSVHHQEFIHCTLSNGICHTGL